MVGCETISKVTLIMKNYNKMDVLKIVLRKYKSQLATCVIIMTCFVVFSLNSIHDQGYGYGENFSIKESGKNCSCSNYYLECFMWFCVYCHFLLILPVAEFGQIIPCNL